jgi:erythromycin 12 hydroxylase
VPQTSLSDLDAVQAFPVSPPVRPASYGADWDLLLHWLSRMRERHPVWPDQGLVHVFRHADVQRVLSDWQVFSSDRTALMPDNAQLGRGNLTMMDPPDHTVLRKVVTQAFTPRKVAALEPQIVGIAERLVADLDAAGFDLVERLAGPLPVEVIAEILGVPLTDRALFQRWSIGFSRGEPDVMQQMHDYLVEQCHDRRTRPQDDLISGLVRADLSGRCPTDDEAASLAGLLLLAGHITTTVLIGNAMLALHEDDRVRDIVLGDPTGPQRLVSETLRHRPPFTRIARLVLTDVQLSGRVVPAGSVAMAWVLSANHDESVFPDGGRVRLFRETAGQLAFGHGIHFCLGTALARLEGRIALQVLMRRFPRLRVSAPDDLEFHDHPTLGLKRLQVTG